MVRHLRPAVAHTQVEVYRIALGRAGIQASILPLFSNIPRVHSDGWVSLLEPLVSKAAGRKLGRDKVYLAGIFGAVAPEWEIEKPVKTLLPLLERTRKRLVLVFCGRSNLSQEAFYRLKLVLGNRADLVVTGERPDIEISSILESLDLGLATTPRQNIQKSGSAAAMLEHDLHVLVTRDDWRLRGGDSRLETPCPRLLSPEEFLLLTSLPERHSQPSANGGVRDVAAQMATALSSPAAGERPALAPRLGGPALQESSAL